MCNAADVYFLSKFNELLRLNKAFCTKAHVLTKKHVKIVIAKNGGNAEDFGDFGARRQQNSKLIMLKL